MLNNWEAGEEGASSWRVTGGCVGVHPPLSDSCTTLPTNWLTLREAFHLFEFDIQEFEESLLLLGADDDSDQLVRQLVVKLLQGCLPMYRKRITPQVDKSVFFFQRLTKRFVSELQQILEATVAKQEGGRRGGLGSIQV